MGTGRRNEGEEAFLRFVEPTLRKHGFDELSSRLIAALYLEPEPVAMETLARDVGCSLASASTKLRKAEECALIERRRAPGTKRAYYFMPKDRLRFLRKHIETMLQNEVEPARLALPGIIAAMRRDPKRDVKREAIIKEYQRQTGVLETALTQFLQLLEREEQRAARGCAR